MKKEIVDNLLPLVEVNVLGGADKCYRDDEIGPGKKITLHFSLALAPGGAIIDSNFEKVPACFSLGDGNFLPGFERVLLGLKKGHKETIILPCQQAFGVVNEDNILTYSRKQFPIGLKIEDGLMINFSDVTGSEQTAVVSDYNSNEVIMDFNHPLAGKEIEFKFEILEIESITKL